MPNRFIESSGLTLQHCDRGVQMRSHLLVARSCHDSSDVRKHRHYCVHWVGIDQQPKELKVTPRDPFSVAGLVGKSNR